MRYAQLAGSRARFLALLAAGAAAACSCDEQGGLQGRSPDLRLTARPQAGEAYSLLPGPQAVAFGAVRVGEEVLVAVELSNDGAADLQLAEPPSLAAGSDAFELREVLTAACAGQGAAPGGTLLQPGTCAALLVAFHPHGVGELSDDLVIRSNDPDSGDLRVPLRGAGTTPDATVCAEGSCTGPGVNEITLDFGRVLIGAQASKTVTVKNAGDLRLELSPYRLEGDRDFTVAPSPSAVTLEPDAEQALQVTFSPTAGGPRGGTLTVVSDDPDQGTLVVHLVGAGDAGRLCIDPFPTLDFGEVEVGTTKDLEATVSNCGTQPLSISEITMLSDVFSSGAVAYSFLEAQAARTLQPEEAFPLRVRLDAQELTSISGRVKFVSDDPSGQTVYLGLAARIHPPNVCDLQPMMPGLDFGQTVVGSPRTADVVFQNTGFSPCQLPAGAVQIPNGAGVTFRIVSMPPPDTEVGPQGTATALVRVTVEYIPTDTTGPDTATLTVTPSSGAAAAVALSGTPVAEGTCQLEMLFPSTGGMFGRTLNFGTVRVLRRKEMQIQIVNRGAATCTINSAVKTSVMPFSMGNAADFSITSLPGALPFSVAPGAQVSIGVTYRPQAEYAYDPSFPEYAVQIQTSDQRYAECAGFGSPGGGTPGCMQVALAGKGVQSVLEIVPERLEFGEVTVGCSSREKSFTVYNIAAQGMSVTDIVVDPPGAPFLVATRPNLPITPFNAGMQFSVSIKYRPPDTNPHNGQVLITTDDGSGVTDVYAVPLTGTGTFDSHQTDTFPVPTMPKTDVLWIVDNSGSMGEEQSLLDDNAERFVTVATSLNSDFRMAVITTDTEDGGQNGKFQGNPKVIDTTTANPARTLGSRFGGLGTSGSGTEKGLQAAQNALSEPLISDATNNANFLRADAKLAVVVVSDEDDFSDGTLDFYEAFFWSIKGRRNTALFTFNSVVGDNPSGCSSSNGSADAGARYIDMSRRTSGIVESICASDWGQIASNLGLDVFTPIAEFRLTREADGSSLSVTVDGRQQAVGTDFTYDAVSNSVVFVAGREPGPGSTVVADYDTYCGP